MGGRTRRLKIVVYRPKLKLRITYSMHNLCSILYTCTLRMYVNFHSITVYKSYTREICGK